MMDIEFKGEYLYGKCNLDTTKMICVPAKEKYNEVDICLKSDNEAGANVSVCVIDGLSLPYDQKKILGYEIARRWNDCKTQEQELDRLKNNQAKLIEALKPFAERGKVLLNIYGEELSPSILHVNTDDLIKASQTMKEVCGEDVNKLGNV